MKYMYPMTDLALETHEFHAEKGEDDGIKLEKYNKFGIELTKAIITTGEGEEKSGKRAGEYITADIGDICLKTKKEFEYTAYAISELIKNMIPSGENCVLVAGVGNSEIVTDALGPWAVSKVIATRHIKKLKSELYESLNLSETVTIQTNVMGNTGIESAELVSAVVKHIKPKCVIAVDSLASRRLSRLVTTVQISDTGISPGSGISNKRLELTEQTLGVPVIAIGIPTVVDAFTLVYDLTGKKDCLRECEEKNNFYVSPKESDKIIKTASELLAASINLAVHKLKYSDLEELL